jgi:hypothetical protein
VQCDGRRRPRAARHARLQTTLYLSYHSDPSDGIRLLCLRKARSGGLSSLVSVAAVYNEIREQPLSRVEIEALDLFDEVSSRTTTTRRCGARCCGCG